jgi:hypothetical protein
VVVVQHQRHPTECRRHVGIPQNGRRFRVVVCVDFEEFGSGCGKFGPKRHERFGGPAMQHIESYSPLRQFGPQPQHLAVQVWRAILESTAAEHGARMSAMDAASRNAKAMIERLTLTMNRARQAAITKELMEIIGGAEALSG